MGNKIIKVEIGRPNICWDNERGKYIFIYFNSQGAECFCVLIAFGVGFIG